MATLDLIDIAGYDSKNEPVSAYFSNNGDFQTTDLPRLATVPNAGNVDGNGNNFKLEFVLSDAQTQTYDSGTGYIVVENSDGTGQATFNKSPRGGNSSAGTFASKIPSIAETPFNTTGPTGATGTNGTNGAAGATGPAGTNGINGATGAQGPQGVAGAIGATGSMGSIGATGPQGPTGPQGVPGPSGTKGNAGSVGIEFVATTQNTDGTTTYQFTGGSYFDGKSYSAVSDTRDATGALTVETRDKNDGSHGVSIYQGGQTVTSSFFDTFNNGGAPDTTFVFNPGFGRDVVNLFRVDGTDHDTLSFKGSDYGNDIATVLNSARDTNAGLLITDPVASSPGGGPGTHDTLLLKGITKQQLAQNQGDIAFHA